MFELTDGRSSAYQWDTGLTLRCDGLTETDTVHFVRPGLTLAVHPTASGEGATVPVPDELLQTAADIVLFAYVRTPEGDITRVEGRLGVTSRPKPPEYVYTPAEVLHFRSLEERIETLEKAGGTGTAPGIPGTTDYNALENKPSINGVPLHGNKTAAQLGIIPTAAENTADLYVWEKLTGQPGNILLAPAESIIVSSKSNTDPTDTWETRSYAEEAVAENGKLVLVSPKSVTVSSTSAAAVLKGCYLSYGSAIWYIPADATFTQVNNNTGSITLSVSIHVDKAQKTSLSQSLGYVAAEEEDAFPHGESGGIWYEPLGKLGDALHPAAGPYYTPVVTQPTADTLQMEFTPSQSGLPAVAAASIALPRGADGRTPVRGTDYWTEADKSELVAAVVAALPIYDGEVQPA